MGGAVMGNPHEAGTEEWARHESHPYVSRYQKEPHNPAYCCESVHDGGRSVGFHQCSRKPKVWYGGLGYCGQHDPAAVIAKRAARDAKWRAEWAAKERTREAAQAKKKLKDAALEAIRKIAAGHNDPRSLALEILSQETTPPSMGEDS